MTLRLALKTVIVANVALVLELIAYRWLNLRVASGANWMEMIKVFIVFTLATGILTPVAALYEETRNQVAVMAGGYVALGLAVLVSFII